jgi:hypothetical protein
LAGRLTLPVPTHPQKERQLFERMQQLMKAKELARLGKQLKNALEDATQSCTYNRHNQTTACKVVIPLERFMWGQPTGSWLQAPNLYRP